MKQILLVDGYNMIGAWQELRTLRDKDFDEARNRLVALLSEYQAVRNIRVIVVFDAYLVQGKKRQYNQSGVEVVYTAKNETADEYIEKQTNVLKSRRTQIHVATSDMTEQHIVFGNGALRKSARELEIEVSIQQKYVETNVRKNNDSVRTGLNVSQETLDALEKLRRGL